jgi:hypothetical protein
VVVVISGCSRSERTGQSTGDVGGSAGSGATAGGSGDTSSSAGTGVAAGSGGAAAGGTNGDAGFAGSAGSAGGRAGAPTVIVHECPQEPEPPCTPNIFDGIYQSGGTTPLSALEGVTEITGDVYLYQAAGFDVLHCLERVGGSLHVTGGGFYDGTLWGLRNLRYVGEQVRLEAGLNEIHVDCGLSRLETVGDPEATLAGSVVIRDLRGELDLSRLARIMNIQVIGTFLERVILPNEVTLGMMAFEFSNNALLTEIAGFENVTIQLASGGPLGLESVTIVDNPLLPSCRAEQLSDLFVQAGWDPADVMVSGNSPDCP